jgi:hypothetical protein
MTEPFDYLQRRLAAQRQWHNDKAAWNKRRYYSVEIATLLAGAAIPIVNLWVADPFCSRVLSGLLGGVVVVAAGVGKLFKFQENWLQFRTLTETLEREEELYKTGVGEYAAAADEAGRNRLLVERTESVLAGSVSQFIATHRAARVGAPAEDNPAS